LYAELGPVLQTIFHLVKYTLDLLKVELKCCGVHTRKFWFKESSVLGVKNRPERSELVQIGVRAICVDVRIISVLAALTSTHKVMEDQARLEKEFSKWYTTVTCLKSQT